MKTRILFSILIFFSFNLSAQFAIIKGEGNVDVCLESNVSRVIGKLRKTDVFWCIASKDQDWYPMDIERGKNSKLSGVVHKSKIQFIWEFDTLSSIETGNSKVVIKGKGIEVHLKVKSFDINKANIQYDSTDNYKYVKKIDHEGFWGTDGTIPKKEYEYIKIKFGNNEVDLPRSAFKNLFEPNLHYTKVNYDIVKDVLYISSFNSDGAGAYQVVWVIEKKKYMRKFNFVPF